MSAAAVIEAEGLAVRLGGRLVVDGVDFRASAGRVVAVIGPNGAGKSTLLRALAGLVPAERGVIRIAGAPLASYDARALGRRLAYLPQARALHWSVSVETLVELGRAPHQRWRGRLTDEDRAAVEQALAAMDLLALRQRPANEISGGELARVLTARALAQGGDVLIADEPVAGLDPAHQLALFAHVERLAQAGRCVIVALHDLTLALRFCQDAILLEGGRVLACGPAADVITPALVEAAYGVTAYCGVVAETPVVVPLWPLA
ncbi:MAG: ABC transporter ATP-binding protein [Hyphomicrobiaceae bacterium]